MQSFKLQFDVLRVLCTLYSQRVTSFHGANGNVVLAVTVSVRLARVLVSRPIRDFQNASNVGYYRKKTFQKQSTNFPTTLSVKSNNEPKIIIIKNVIQVVVDQTMKMNQRLRH